MMGKWSLEEDVGLCQATKTCGEGNWKEIAHMLPLKRTIRQCCFKYRTIVREVSRNKVEPEERETTLTQVAKTSNASQPRKGRKEKKLSEVVAKT